MDPVQAFLQANALTAPLFPPTSRYFGIPAAEHTLPDGLKVAFLRRRFVPPPERFALLREHVVVAGDRLDNLSARHLGDPQQFWRICDANRAVRPDELIETYGRLVRITLPEGVAGVPHAG